MHLSAQRQNIDHTERTCMSFVCGDCRRCWLHACVSAAVTSICPLPAYVHSGHWSRTYLGTRCGPKLEPTGGPARQRRQPHAARTGALYPWTSAWRCSDSAFGSLAWVGGSRTGAWRCWGQLVMGFILLFCNSTSVHNSVTSARERRSRLALACPNASISPPPVPSTSPAFPRDEWAGPICVPRALAAKSPAAMDWIQFAARIAIDQWSKFMDEDTYNLAALDKVFHLYASYFPPAN